MAGRSAPRPKREAEAFARTHYNDPDSSASKKPRFDPRNPSLLAGDAADDDITLDADEIGQAQGIGVKRNAVNIDGYDSDSDPDVERWKKDNPADVADDMFADMADGDADENASDDGRRKEKKAVRFMNENDIQGQVMSSKSGGHVSADLLAGRRSDKKPRTDDASESSDSGDDEERAAVPNSMDEELGAGSKKKHAPKLEAFNLRSENEEGKFDENGNYVRKAGDPNEVHDRWLDGISKKDVKTAREAHEKREQERRQREREKDGKLAADLYSDLIKHLHVGETPIEALQRLGKSNGKTSRLVQQRKKKGKQSKEGNGMDVDPDTTETPAEAQRREAVEAITEAASILQDRGDQEIYETERELLMRQYKRDTGEDWQDPESTNEAANGNADKQWYFRWADARDGVDAHGPYDLATMKAWTDAGYFGEGVEFRQGQGESWTRLADFDV